MRLTTTACCLPLTTHYVLLASQIHADNEKLQSEVAGALRNLAGEKTPAEKEAEEAKKVADAAAESSAATPAVAKPGGGPTPKGGKTTPASIPAAAPVSPTASPGTSARPNPLARKNSGFKAGGVAAVFGGLSRRAASPLRSVSRGLSSPGRRRKAEEDAKAKAKPK